MKNKYYGKKEIIDEDVYLDDPNRIELTFSDKTTEIIPKKMYNAAVSDKPLEGDLTELRTRRIMPVVKDLLNVLLSWDIYLFDPMNELDYITKLLEMSIQNNINMATEKKLGKLKKNVKLSDIDKILKE